MCGRFQLVANNKTDTLMDALGVDGGPLHYANDIAPGSPISFIHQAGSRVVDTATWWLLLDHKTGKPNYKYASFNSRSDKLNQPRSLAYKPFRESRCIIPASAFVEGLGDRKTYHRIELADEAIAFGGLYKTNVDPDSGEIVYSASIITLPPVPQWRHIHPKSIPLMLDPDNTDLIDRWLDPEFTDVSEFDTVLEPSIHKPQLITPIGKPSRWNPTGDSFMLHSD